MYKYIYMVNFKLYIYLEPKWPLFFEGQPSQNKAFSNQNKGHLGSRYIYLC